MEEQVVTKIAKSVWLPVPYYEQKGVLLFLGGAVRMGA
jgi:hypothetical protein